MWIWIGTWIYSLRLQQQQQLQPLEPASPTVCTNNALAGTSLLVTANVPTLLILSTLKIEAACSSEMSVLTRPTWCHISKKMAFFTVTAVKTLKFYKALTVWTL
jgi:hypothetical protein